MFSYMSVCHFIHRRSPCDHYSWCIRPHCTGSPSRHGALPQLALVSPSPPDMGLGPQSLPHLLVTSGGHHWRPVQTCSLDLIVQAPPSPPPLLLTFGGHQSTYSWQVDGMHPTGMLSCVVSFVHFGWRIVPELWKSIIGCPYQQLIKYVIIANLHFEAYFEVFYLFWVEDSTRTLKVHHWLPRATPKLVCGKNKCNAFSLVQR